jgi:hypothetical protein
MQVWTSSPSGTLKFDALRVEEVPILHIMRVVEVMCRQRHLMV